MDYLLEQLGSGRFQQLCQALIAKEHQDVQCVPLRQPDGGRDIVRFIEGSHREIVVFQVKYVEKPMAELDPHKWLTRVVREEAPKIAKLLGSAPRAYVLMTNVPGTAHPKTGAVDRMQELLDQHFSIPARCYWRDDISRRLDDAWSIKWSYPEIFTSADLLHGLVESGLADEGARRTAAIRAFLATQFDADAEIKFKQVELQNQLLDLYVDVPARPRFDDVRDLRFRRELGSIAHVRRILALAGEEPHHFSDTPMDDGEVGAAALLLREETSKLFPLLVLEGGPGQGKSTIAQYVCQVHRIRFLGREHELQRLPEPLRHTPVRIPFRVDLRDFAAWLKGENPFGEDQLVRVAAVRSLESFLAAQVSYLSGGIEFSVADLHAVAQASSLLLLLDGFDEVADVAEREVVIREVRGATTRLKETTLGLQVVVTSRPAAFANSPGFPREMFRYCELTDLKPLDIANYCEKWSIAKDLNEAEAIELRNVLDERLEQPHLRDLARNPMQLAILLSLIRSLGSSLPDKRTALYDAYVRLFFDREGEKTATVKEHREVLIDIHRFLGWELHSRAEQEASRGRIQEEALRLLLRDYLVEEGRDPTLATTLFTAAIDRVVFLVSRLEGTFEFEVQPLREYFAARHLYETAPYSPPGVEAKGTKPEVFEAISRNFYWLNVARFFAGCYSKGELASLADNLIDLEQDSQWALTDHPRLLSSMLLSDGVFSQSARAQRQTVDLCLRAVSGRRPFNGTALIGSHSFTLPRGAGQEELVTRAFAEMKKGLPADFYQELVSLINANTEPEERLEGWLAFNAAPDALASLRLAADLNVLSLTPIEDVAPLLEQCASLGCLDVAHTILLNAGRLEICCSSAASAESTVSGILASPYVFDGFSNRELVSPLQALALVFQWHPEGLLFRQREDFYWLEGEQLGSAPSQPWGSESAEVENSCARIVDLYRELRRDVPDPWRTRLDPWARVIDVCNQAFGETWVSRIAAVIAAGVQSRSERGNGASDLFDHSADLVDRVRYARLRAGDARWWTATLMNTRRQSDIQFALLVLVTWGSAGTLKRLRSALEEKVDELAAEGYSMLINGIQIVRWATGERGMLHPAELPKTPSARLIRILALRVSYEERSEVYLDQLEGYGGSEENVCKFVQESEFQLAIHGESRWGSALAAMHGAYMKTRVAGDLFFSVRRANTELEEVVNRIPLVIAQVIVKSPADYPYELVALAEARCREHLQSGIVSVAETAQNESWEASFSPK